MTENRWVKCRFNYDMGLGIPDPDYHESLIYETGNTCFANIHDATLTRNGYWMVECDFESGNQLTVYLDELTVL